ncbi:NADH-quinone oxidoreductase, chain G [Nitrosococcus halophilus Nc 4]|uniref:NADH-quinone oxidoreductase n=1 Tax=Nitrosococcus halophilus (strain Nc4) TaxID=472759 RepID=D5C512_NITHN|nr:NADH-quinone oxidoreductase subunit NuoG [Nitrosococcus halophilus]ADE15235.1 NADH-quinone oxidoreductase, chain G [Nitrosococcus halophilus Nc 4]
MAVIHIDDQSYEVDAGHNLLQTCLSLGFDLPYFCWHPAMGSVGACRQCAVKQFQDEKDTQGRIVMSCMTPAQDGTRISIHNPEARAFRASIIEWLMINHPHDCPVCEEGGECHLQDMTQMSGHTYRRYRFKKRTFRNQYLGPFIKHEMNRCIACYRCVRFYREYAGGHDLNVFATHHHVFFGRHEDGVLENEFSGNLVEVCPTGVFTDKTLSARYTRKWDLQTAPSVCVHCSLGCNTSPGERYGELRRIQNRYNGEINGYFLCDRGRFGYDFVNSKRRIRQPRERKGEKTDPLNKPEARQHLASLLSQAGRIMGIGSPRASLEANFALRTLVGPANFYSGMAAREQQLVSLILDILKNSSVHPASLQDAEQADAILILGEDVTNTAPRLALTLRQSVRQRAFEIADQQKIPHWQDSAVREAAQQQRSPLFIASPTATRLDDIATQTWQGAPEDLARLGFAIAHELNPDAPGIADLSGELGELAQSMAQALKSAKRPLVVSGTGCQSGTVLQAAANVALALRKDERPIDLLFTVPECNSLGLGLMEGGDLDQAFKALEEGMADTLIVLENDLYRRADNRAIESALNRAQQLIVIDHLDHATAAKAQLVLPAATFAEGDGTLLNHEGRAQRFFQVFVPEGDIQESWRWLSEAMAPAGSKEGLWQRLDEVTRACAESIASLQDITQAAPPAKFRLQGMRIARESHRYSGRTAMGAHRNVHEPKTPEDPDSPFSFSMEGYYGQLPGALIPYFWAPSWNSIQSVNKFQEEVGGPLRGGDPGVRLIEPPSGAKIAYFTQTPPPFQRRVDQWLILPLYHIFGSEELSALAPAIAERAPAPYLALHPEDAAQLEVEPSGQVELILAGKSYHLPVRHQDSLPLGVAGIPWGLPAWKARVALPAWGQLSKGAP